MLGGKLAARCCYSATVLKLVLYYYPIGTLLI